MAIGRCRIAVLLGPRIAVLPDTHLTGWIRSVLNDVGESVLNDVGERDRSESPRTGLKKPHLPTLRAPGLPASEHYRRYRSSVRWRGCARHWSPAAAGDTRVVTNLDRLAGRCLTLATSSKNSPQPKSNSNIGGSVHDRTTRSGGCCSTNRIRHNLDAHLGRHEGRQSRRPTPRQGTQTKPRPRGISRRDRSGSA